MTIHKTNSLTLQQKEEIRDLLKICFALEHMRNEPLLSNNLNKDKNLPCFILAYEGRMLAGFLEAFFPTYEEVEINAFVHPIHRKKGIFSSLVTEAQKTYEPHPFLQMLFQVESSSQSGKAYMGNHFPQIDRSEYRLRLSKSRWMGFGRSKTRHGKLVKATGNYRQQYIQSATSLLREDAPFIERMLSEPNREGYLYLHENNPIGVLQKCEENESLTMLSAVAIDEAFRGQGHGKAMLTHALDEFFLSYDSLSLEVDSQNPKAFELYRNVGFEIDYRVDYHLLELHKPYLSGSQSVQQVFCLEEEGLGK